MNKHTRLQTLFLIGITLLGAVVLSGCHGSDSDATTTSKGGAASATAPVDTSNTTPPKKAGLDMTK